MKSRQGRRMPRRPCRKGSLLIVRLPESNGELSFHWALMMEARKDIGKEAFCDELLSFSPGNAAGEEVEELFPIHGRRGAAVGAADVIGQNFEAGQGVGCGLFREHHIPIRLVGVGVVCSGGDVDVACEGGGGVSVDNVFIEQVAGGAPRCVNLFGVLIQRLVADKAVCRVEADGGVVLAFQYFRYGFFASPKVVPVLGEVADVAPHGRDVGNVHRSAFSAARFLKLDLKFRSLHGLDVPGADEAALPVGDVALNDAGFDARRGDDAGEGAEETVRFVGDGNGGFGAFFQKEADAFAEALQMEGKDFVRADGLHQQFLFSCFPIRVEGAVSRSFDGDGADIGHVRVGHAGDELSGVPRRLPEAPIFVEPIRGNGVFQALFGQSFFHGQFEVVALVGKIHM